MKELRFRGINTQTGRWIFGDSIKHTDNPGMNGTLEDIVYIGGKVPNARKQGAMKWTPVEPNTVGLFTGMLDKNGKEIYEGDILRFGSKGWACEVGWNDAVGAFCVRFYFELELGLMPLGSWLESKWIVHVIGNIHDHPELLKSD